MFLQKVALCLCLFRCYNHDGKFFFEHISLKYHIVHIENPSTFQQIDD